MAHSVYKTAPELGFKKTGAEDLLKLEAFNPSQDTPVEVLHTVMLGIIKYMLNYTGSFVGQDFKQLIQVLPIILTTTFKDDEGLQVVAPVFVQLGKLSSLVFMHSVEHHFDDYSGTPLFAQAVFSEKSAKSGGVQKVRLLSDGKYNTH
ncbi:hypothetical protein BJV82DRAFT_696885 [Fennellomyces sp. T-0311]|nr:hypothetical protein BJV82DRAFT_696885 [Fennellomyces sp. T-0311]